MKVDRSLIDDVDAASQPLDFAIAKACEAVSHNHNGQRLGPKGRLTRERIIRAAIYLLEEQSAEPFTLTAVARKASLGMSSLYNYFNDISELMEASLDSVMTAADATYIEAIGVYWPDDMLAEKSRQFWKLYREFWNEHAALLHRRNRMSDGGDERILRNRFVAVEPLLRLVQFQLGLGDHSEPEYDVISMSGVLVTAIERTMTVSTDPFYMQLQERRGGLLAMQPSLPGAKLLEIAIRDSRQSLRGMLN